MREGSDSLGLLSGDSEQAHSGGGPGSSARCWPGSAARASILRLCPGERSFYAGLGMGVLLTALFGGVSAAFAVGYALHESVRQLWPVAVFWALALVNIDRLLQRRRLCLLARLARHRPVNADGRISGNSEHTGEFLTGATAKRVSR
jgi:hypothetical protein